MYTGKFVSDRTDIYSYGLVLYEMLTLFIPNFDVFPEEEDFSDEEEFNSAYENAELEFDSLLGIRLIFCTIRMKEMDLDFLAVFLLYSKYFADNPEEIKIYLIIPLH